MPKKKSKMETTWNGQMSKKLRKFENRNTRLTCECECCDGDFWKDLLSIDTSIDVIKTYAKVSILYPIPILCNTFASLLPKDYNLLFPKCTSVLILKQF